MNGLAWSTGDNTTKVLEDATQNSTVALPTTSKSSAGQSVSTELATTVGFVVSSISICANAVLFAVLIRARREFGSSVHSLIANQSAMDLFASVFVVASLVVNARGYGRNGDRIWDSTICVLLESGALHVIGITAGKLGLVVITLERYFKIVHAVAHRKFYRDWMTSVGMAVPWIVGTCLILFPAMGTTRIVNGRCLRMGVWPNKSMHLVNLHICAFSMFVCNFFYVVHGHVY